jgi:hypothetical protein
MRRSFIVYLIARLIGTTLGNEIDDSILFCINALRELSPGRISIANQASSDVSLLAMKTDRDGFAVDIGNYDLCERGDSMWHCLSGSILRDNEFIALPPHSGVCVPEVCSALDLSSIGLKLYVDETLSLLTDNAYTARAHAHNVNQSGNLMLSEEWQQQFSYYIKLRNAWRINNSSNAGFTCGPHHAWMTVDRYLFFSVFAVVIVTVIGATLYHMASTGWDFETMKNVSEKSATGEIHESLAGSGEFHSDAYWTASNVFRRTIEAFSLVKNVPYIFKPPSPTERDKFSILDGIRAISILWIILSHTMAVTSSIGIMNPAAILPPTGFLKDVSAQIFMSARFAVDTFFFISGFLVVLSLLKRLNPVRYSVSGSNLSALNNNAEDGSGKSESSLRSHPNDCGIDIPPLKTWLPLFYMHRCIRILPPYVFCLLVVS